MNDQDPSPRIVAQAPLKEEGQEKGDLGRGDTMPGFLNLLIKNRRFLGQR